MKGFTCILTDLGGCLSSFKSRRIFCYLQTFQGNFDPSTPVVNHFDSPVYATYVRIYPLSYNSWTCLRFDVLGCWKGILYTGRCFKSFSRKTPNAFLIPLKSDVIRFSQWTLPASAIPRDGTWEKIITGTGGVYSLSEVNWQEAKFHRLCVTNCQLSNFRVCSGFALYGVRLI